MAAVKENKLRRDAAAKAAAARAASGGGASPSVSGAKVHKPLWRHMQVPCYVASTHRWRCLVLQKASIRAASTPLCWAAQDLVCTLSPGSEWHLEPYTKLSAARHRPSLRSRAPAAVETQQCPWRWTPRSHSSQPERRRRPGTARSHRRPRSRRRRLSSQQPSRRRSSSRAPSRCASVDHHPSSDYPAAASRTPPALRHGVVK
jgi:hypothetical protein